MRRTSSHRLQGLWLAAAFASLSCLASLACLRADRGPGRIATETKGPPAKDLLIPTLSDWTDYGTIFEHGALGEWDFQLFGAGALCAVKKDGTYYLYYLGASGYRIADDTVTWRAIGAATSPDGINFTKYAGNPVLTWFPNNDGEEGAVMCGATLDLDGEVVVFYGANTKAGATTVNADGRLAVSADGLRFADRGMVLDHTDPSVWGSGDELFPAIAFEEAGQWVVYYWPNGTPERRKLGVAWGPGRDQLDNSAPALSAGSTIPMVGSGSAVRINADTYALFTINPGNPIRLEVRTVGPSLPDQLSAPVVTYEFDGFRRGIVFLDPDTETWFLYYRDTRRYGVKLAPAGNPDTSPPTAPASVTAMPASNRQIDLAWEPASDAETGIVQFRVFRDGEPIATVKGWSFSDGGVAELSEYGYEVSAINYHGVEGPKSVPVVATTPADTTPPGFERVTASGSATEVVVVFDEPVEQASAETPSNYGVDQGIAVSGSSLAADLRTVTLTTSEQFEHVTYRLTAADVRDRAQSPNTMPSPIELSYTFSGAAGLAGCWRLEEGSGTTALDTANFGHDGSLVYPGEDPAQWTAGVLGGALQFDGLDDLVTIEPTTPLAAVTDGSHTFAAWARAADVPPATANNNTFYSILTRGRGGLFYGFDQRFKAAIYETTGEISVFSDPVAPGEWHHLAMVVDGESREVHLYVDGQEVFGSPVPYTGALADHAGAEYLIGTADPLVERWDQRFKGEIDEVRVYDRALTVNEIQALANPCTGDVATGDKDGDGICGDMDECRGDDASGDGDGDGICADIDRDDADNAIQRWLGSLRHLGFVE